MTRTSDVDAELRAIPVAGWPVYLDAHSGLPGPRANLTLVDAVARVADEAAIDELERDGGEYSTLCVAAALGRRADDPAIEVRARALAADERWRVREGVARGLQLLGDVIPDALASIVRRWADDADPLVQRAAVAAICEPRLLRAPESAALALDVCRRCTEHLAALPRTERSRNDVRSLRQALGYGWSVAVAADPVPGLIAFQALSTADPDIAWIVKENLRKKRLSALV
ncbi:HEAT repeat domain-containing protein [Agromyces atrinae]|uniref:HEAT repeat domain-containing protein n=1 Tax=Agromyces atrinae TaxID=592376 RepID=UPI001F5ADCA4|nr:HEAT repeat domain-containing protein [Agromyces atrinae]MCI2958419.1 HEAT repeat domain-containing protein [Agromyces atrinae]